MREICSNFPVSHKSKPEEQFKIQAMVLDLNRYLASCRAGYTTLKEGEEDGEDGEDEGEDEDGEEGEDEAPGEDEDHEDEGGAGACAQGEGDRGEEDLSAEEHWESSLPARRRPLRRR